MIRELKLSDANRMHEWMHDEDVIKYLQAGIFRNKTIDDCICFIEASQTDENNCNMAIVDDKDVYQGTVSLKNIDKSYRDAEFAIVLIKDAQGKGYAKQAIADIMAVAFQKYQLNQVYWNVLEENDRAISLYRKCGYKELSVVSSRIRANAPKDKKLLYFATNSL